MSQSKRNGDGEGRRDYGRENERRYRGDDGGGRDYGRENERRYRDDGGRRRYERDRTYDSRQRGGGGDYSRRSSGSTCYNCGERGHFSRECPRPKRGDDRDYRGGRRRYDGGGGERRKGGAQHLARIHGTEEDRVNCPFFFKIGACRHGDRCSRLHNKPAFSQTVLIPHMYKNPLGEVAVNPDAPPPDREKIEKEFKEFYEEVFDELSQYGFVEEMHVCDNLGVHIVGNVYVKFRREEDAEECKNAMAGRCYKGTRLNAEFSPVTDFREARCRQFDEAKCSRGAYCNFMHIKYVSRSFQRELIDDQDDPSSSSSSSSSSSASGSDNESGSSSDDDYDDERKEKDDSNSGDKKNREKVSRKRERSFSPGRDRDESSDKRPRSDRREKMDTNRAGDLPDTSTPDGSADGTASA